MEDATLGRTKGKCEMFFSQVYRNHISSYREGIFHCNFNSIGSRHFQGFCSMFSTESHLSQLVYGFCVEKEEMGLVTMKGFKVGVS